MRRRLPAASAQGKGDPTVDATWLAELLSLRFESKGVAASEHGTYKSGKGYVLEEWDEVASRLGRQAEHGSR